MRRTALALGLVLIAACGAPVERNPSTASPSAAAPPVPGITAEAVQLRTDAAVGGQVHVRISATQAFTVTSLALASPGFTPLPDDTLTAVFAPGRVIDLPAPYGEPVCSADPLPAVARLGVVRPGGGTEVVDAPLDAEVLGRIHEAECAVRALAEVVDVAVTGLREDGDAVTGELVLTRRRDGDVSVVRINRSVLMDVGVDGLPLELDGDRTTATVSFTPATCDAHVLSESKQPYRFPLSVATGEEEPVAMDLPLDDGDRELLAALVRRICADAE